METIKISGNRYKNGASVIVTFEDPISEKLTTAKAWIVQSEGLKPWKPYYYLLSNDKTASGENWAPLKKKYKVKYTYYFDPMDLADSDIKKIVPGNQPPLDVPEFKNPEDAVNTPDPSELQPENKKNYDYTYILRKDLLASVPPKLIDAVFKAIAKYDIELLKASYYQIGNGHLEIQIWKDKDFAFINQYPIATSMILDDIIISILGEWKQESSDASAKLLEILRPVFEFLKKRNDNLIILNPKHKVAYRSTTLTRSIVQKFMSNTKRSDWNLTKLAGVPYYVYAKSKFQYKPKRNYQSWTVAPGEALDFHPDFMLAAKTNPKDFYFDPGLFRKINVDFGHEAETIHRGQDLKVVLGISKAMFEKLMPGDTTKIKADYKAFINKALKI